MVVNDNRGVVLLDWLSTSSNLSLFTLQGSITRMPLVFRVEKSPRVREP